MSLDRKHALIVLGIATVAFTVILELIDPSHVSHGPTILDFEFAGSRSHAAQIMAEWGRKGLDAARLSLIRDWDRLARLLHPEVHWTTAAEDELHGADAVVRRLSGDPPPAPPSYHEVRDGLVWRWIDCPG